MLQLESWYSFACDKKLNIWMMDKGEWHRGLADEARGLGINIIENCPISMEMYKRIKSENDWVIDATGAPSITSMIYGFSKFYTTTPAVTAQYKLEGDFSSLFGKFKVGIEENVLGPKIKSDKMFFKLWKILGRNCFEDIIENMSNNRSIKVSFSDLFNGKIKLLKLDLCSKKGNFKQQSLIWKS